MLQGEGGTVASLLRRTASLTNTLADRDAVIGRVITNLNAVLATLDERDAQLDQTIVAAAAVRLRPGRRPGRDRRRAGQPRRADRRHRRRCSATPGPAWPPTWTLLGKLAGTLNDNAEVIDGTLRPAARPVRRR